MTSVSAGHIILTVGVESLRIFSHRSKAFAKEPMVDQPLPQHVAYNNAKHFGWFRLSVISNV